MFGFECYVTERLSAWEKKSVVSLLETNGLCFEGSPQFTALALDSEENTVATASLDGSVIKMVAADEKWREAGLSATVISSLLQAARAKGLYHFFIYTKPEAAVKFGALGFNELASTKTAVLMECGTPNEKNFRTELAKLRETNNAGAAVMNCNPFTLGHRYLIEEGASRVPLFYVIAVEEDASAFPFKDRLELIRRGTADLKNVRVITSGSYAVSKATFPTYFLKDKAALSVAEVQAELDASLFGRLFVPELGITKRMIGTEPYSEVTAVYNKALKKVLPALGCEVIETERKACSKGAISATRVRELLASGREGLEELLPAATLEYLKTESGEAAVKKLRENK